MQWKPDSLPFASPCALSIPGTIKRQPADFQVEEIPLYPFSGAGDHLIIQIEKEGIATLPAIKQIAQHLNMRPEDVGFAGMKDAQSLSLQYLSVEHRTQADIETFAAPKVRIRAVTRHGNKLKVGHLRGNRFRIRLFCELPAGEYEATLGQLSDYFCKHGCPNYYTGQRFGRDGRNALFGHHLLRFLHKHWDSDLAGQDKVSRVQVLRSPRKIRQIWLSALQSFLFNEVVARRVNDNSLDCLLLGDLAWRHVNGSVFLVEDLGAENKRCDAGEISASGLIAGYKMSSPQGLPLEIEQEVLAAAEIQCDLFRVGRGLNQKGARRPLRFFPEEFCWTIEDHSILFECTLGKGCFATALLREICKHDAE